MKHPDYIDRLWSLLERLDRAPFEYGVHDCCTFVADVLDELHDGATYRRKILERYQDEAGARALIAKHGDMERTVSWFLGTPAPPVLARRGDPVLIKADENVLVGICVGADVVCAGDGLVYYPIRLAVCCWRVNE